MASEILIFATNIQVPNEYLDSSRDGVKLKRYKLEFYRILVKFHGHTPNSTGIQPGPDKVRIIADMAKATDTTCLTF